MTEELRQAIVNGSAEISVTVKASDLRAILSAIVRAEKEAMKAEALAENEKAMITRKEAMDMLGVSEPTLTRWAKDKYLVPVKVGRKVLYKRSEINKMLTQKTA